MIPQLSGDQIRDISRNIAMDEYVRSLKDRYEYLTMQDLCVELISLKSVFEYEIKSLSLEEAEIRYRTSLDQLIRFAWRKN